MADLIVTNSFFLSEESFTALNGSDSSVERVKNFISTLQGITEDSDVLEILSDNNSYSLGYENIKINNNVASLVEQLYKVTKKYENIIYIFSDCPLYDFDISKDLFLQHKKYWAEYTFSDGYPIGSTIEILSVNVLQKLLPLSANSNEIIERDTLFKLFQKDINNFDIELKLPYSDLREYRLSFTTESLLNREICNSLLENGYTNLKDFIDNIEIYKPFFRSSPSFFDIQISTDCPQQCSYCYWPKVKKNNKIESGSMSLGEFKIIMSKISSFAKTGWISLSPFGEPSMNPDIYEIIEEVIKTEGFNLLIETSGLNWDIDKINNISKKEKIEWIVSLDTLNSELYNKLRGGDPQVVMDFYNSIEPLFPGKVHAQSVRMLDNEDDLEELYSFFDQNSKSLIIQKYNSSCKRLEDKKVADLSPVNRTDCWHIKRDLVILYNGNVPQCREFAFESTLGNVLKEKIEDIWNNGYKVYKEHIDGNFSQMCRECDEYYTFNF